MSDRIAASLTYCCIGCAVLPIVMLVMTGCTIYQYFYVQKIHLDTTPAVVVAESTGIETEKTAFVNREIKSAKAAEPNLSATPTQHL
jgi:hypothetical protein